MGLSRLTILEWRKLVWELQRVGWEHQLGIEPMGTKQEKEEHKKISEKVFGTSNITRRCDSYEAVLDYIKHQRGMDENE